MSRQWRDRVGYSLGAASFEAPCMECGLMVAFQRQHGRFCGSTCRKAWFRRAHPVPRHVAPEYADLFA